MRRVFPKIKDFRKLDGWLEILLLVLSMLHQVIGRFASPSDEGQEGDDEE